MTTHSAPSPRARFGHHFLIGLQPTVDLDDADKRLLAALQPAGIIVFRGNFLADAPYEEWLARFAGLLQAAREHIGREQILVGIDHEGATVLRPPPPVTSFAFARQFAPQAADVGRAMGVELASLGINLNFAPVLDIDSNPDNPVIGPRAFGITPEEVTAAAGPFLSAMQREGVLACPKHFPGHGDTRTDSHHELPALDLDLDALLARELRPWAALLSSEVKLVMTAHIMFPRLDGERPSTMSPAIVAGLLRGHLGYQGAVVTDDIGMHAVSQRFEQPEATIETLRSGTDLIMVCQHWTRTERALDFAAHIERAAARGELPDDLLQRSSDRITQLLHAATTHQPRVLPAETFARHATLAPLRPRSARAAGQTVSLKE